MPRLELEEGANLPDWRVVIERRDGRITVPESRALKEYTAERGKRPTAHNHENEIPARPVLSFDLHRTLTPEFGFPLIQPPYEDVKTFLDRMVSRNCCIHIMSASMDRADPQISAIRIDMTRTWAVNYGLPIGFVGPNVEANVRLDDRGVRVRGASETTPPDWVAIGKQAEKRLLDTWILDPDTETYIKRTDLTPVGDPTPETPDLAIPLDDTPRAWSTPMLDIDIHRTVNPGWGSTRELKPPPGAAKAIQSLYSKGYQIQMSCAGWMLSTHTPAESAQRLASFRSYFRCYGIPYDRVVTKDDCDLWFDDKVTQYTNWKTALPLVTADLEAAALEHPSLALGQPYQRSESH